MAVRKFWKCPKGGITRAVYLASSLILGVNGVMDPVVNSAWSSVKELV